MTLEQYKKKRHLEKTPEPKAKNSMKDKLLKEYRKKRNFDKTPEPYK